MGGNDEKNDFVSFRDVILENGFWKDRYDLNKTVSVQSVRERFEDTFRFDAMRFHDPQKGNPIHFFYDSDVAKWIEGIDNGERLNQISVSVAAAKNATLVRDFHPLLSIEMEGLRDAEDERLYFPAEECAASPVKLKFIPYFAFANCGASDMPVWIRKI
ncbi:MAG: hypothetical protein J6A84_04925 [Clostridia bacterium]|nr:hypothetical protein [Clostridia bacterium]